MPMSRTNRSDSNPESATLSPQPTWPPPRSPLPPHRLAKLANALGVPTPVPVTHPQAFTLAPTPSISSPSRCPSPNPSDILRRSPTLSATSMSSTPAFSTSKFMLHVVPPAHLPHEPDDLDLTPPPPTASGYHPQFRRGVLVPLYSTLQAQLSAIAREYALPSTSGMVLYLITSSVDDSDEPGPRISEDIWRHIWTRVLKVEKEELLSPGPKPFGIGLGYGMASRSSPTLLQDVATASQLPSPSFRTLVPSRLTDTPQPITRATTHSPSTSHSAYSSQSELDTPDSATSVDPPSHADSLPLPGLESNAPLPILAKVEFDVDKRKAGWYDTWVRSRKTNHAKRAESRAGGRNGSRSNSQADEGEEGTRKAPIDLALVGKMNSVSPSFLLTTETSSDPEELFPDEEVEDVYQQLEDDDGEQLSDAELTARLNEGSPAEDSLEDVFGSDADTWETIHASAERTLHSNPNVVHLALDAAQLSDLPDDLEADDDARLPAGKEETEITDLLNKMTRPVLSVTVPDMPQNRQSTPTTAGPLKRHVPPPLDLQVPLPSNHIAADQPSPLSSGPASAHLAYLMDDSGPDPDRSGVETPNVETSNIGADHSNDEEQVTKARSPEDEKRIGVFYDALNLGLDTSLTEDGEYDDSDPNDRRKSQYIMAAQLDEIERNLAQFSPRRLHSEQLAPEDFSPTRSSHPERSPSIASMLTPRVGDYTLTPRSPGATGGIWPAVPYSSLNDSATEESDISRTTPESPPKIAFNGISTEPPKSPYSKQNRLSAVSDETIGRQRALQEDNGLYPPLITPLMFGADHNDDSPIIPLSPDPFGRYPSEAEASQLAEERQSQLYLDDPLAEEPTISHPPERGSSLGVPGGVELNSRPPSQTPSSRFSLDSVTSEEPAKQASTPNQLTPKQSGLISVKSIRKLWRKSESKRSSISTGSQLGSGRTSPNPVFASVPENQPTMSRVRTKSISKTSFVHPAAQDGIYAMNAPQRHAKTDSMQVIRFDQESPYPVHPSRMRSPSPQRTPSARPSSAHSNRPASMSRPAPRPSSAHGSRPPSVSQSFPVPGSPPERGSTRKSILKSWKSTNGLASASGKGSLSKGSGSSANTPRSSNENLPETVRKRRPSVLDIASSLMRNSISSSSVTLVDIPPSPAIPEQFANQFRASSRQSQTHGNSKQSMSSTSSPPRMRSPLTPNSPPATNTNGLSAAQRRASTDSEGSRPSFDISQFEMVSPPKAALTYPYHALDNSMTSSQE